MKKLNFEDLLALCENGETGLCADSRQIANGDIFVAVAGPDDDGSKYINDAISRGARFIVANPASMSIPLDEDKPFYIPHENPLAALSQLAVKRWKLPEKMKIVGITGTNGKTTSAWLLEHLFNSIGCKTGLLGTVVYRWAEERLEAPLTTPGLVDLHKILYRMAMDQVEMAIMEVSSHALDQHRTGELAFSGALFTNLTQDHLDYHGDMETYFRAKARLFLELPHANKAKAINSDDTYGRRLLELLPDALAFGLHKNFLDNRLLLGSIKKSGPDGLTLLMSLGKQQWKIHSPLVGEFNAMNLLGVQALALEMGVSAQDLEVLESFGGVCGRLEKIENPQGLHIFVDYAHTPDALENALQALRKAGFKRIITVFGCGGNRDRGKRPLMGNAVAKYADVAVLTSDNPRREDPESIINDVLPGLELAKSVHVEADRYKATELALELLEKDDALLIAGKGHEDYQIIGTEKHHYSDQEVVRELLHCN